MTSVRLSTSLFSIFCTNKKRKARRTKHKIYIFLLLAAKMLGPRIGRWDSNKEPAMGSATNTIIGVFMLWWAWIAFNQVKTIINVIFI